MHAFLTSKPSERGLGMFFAVVCSCSGFLFCFCFVFCFCYVCFVVVVLFWCGGGSAIFLFFFNVFVILCMSIFFYSLWQQSRMRVLTYLMSLP